MTEKEIYRKICEEKGSTIPIYSQAWWMDAVCTGKSWDVIIIRDTQNEIVATHPYMLSEKWRQRYIIMPPLTQTNGIHYFHPAGLTERERLTREKDAFREVNHRLHQLDIDYYEQNLEPANSNALPYLWKGYQQTTRYTYRIEDTGDLEKVFAQFTSAKQRQIRKADRNGLKCYTDISAEEFYQFHQMTLALKGETDFIRKEVELRLIEAAITRHQGEIMTVRAQADEPIQAALFSVWDDKNRYYLIPANDGRYRTTGASSKIIWECIKKAHESGQSFDFEGSMQESIENSYNQFGSHQTPYLRISKAYHLPLKIVLAIKELLES